MAVRQFLRWLAAVAAVTLASCVYSFDPEVESSDSRIVVEGSVSIGGTLRRHLSPETLGRVLRNELIPQPEEQPVSIRTGWRGR